MFKRAGGDSDRKPGERAVRHSRAWGEMSKFLQAQESLRVLDFGPTSPANIGYLTQLGHSVYMANPVSDAAGAEWRRPAAAEPVGAAKDTNKGQGTSAEATEFDAERFCASNLDFAGRMFDVILLWDTANYLPPELATPFFRRLQEVLSPGGRLLAFFQAKDTGPETAFSRYQLTDTEDLIMLRSGPFPVQRLYQTRQIDQFFKDFADVRFFLGKDNVREVYAVR